jgi:arylsulfatase A-like enzyme
MVANKHVISVALVLICLCAAISFWRAPILAADSKPNIIFILTDDQRLDEIKHMPILQSLLVRQGISFQNYFCNVSLCCPSRTSILRGQFAHNTGVMTNGGGNGGFGVAHARGVEDSTIAVWLHEKGYKTALIGKYLNRYPGNMGPQYIPPGWDYWASAVRGNAYGEYNYTLNENGELVGYGNKPSSYGTDVYTGKAVNFIKSCKSEGKPFFIYLAFYAPHGPATPAPRHVNLFHDAKVQRGEAFNEADVSSKPGFIQNLPALTEEQIQAADAYYGKRLRSLQAVDEAIESIYNTLSETHQLDNTYIVFASDNGFHLGEHRMLRGKQTAYETDIHLPLIVRGPGVARGAKAFQLVGNIDLAPTFADLAGAKTPDFVDGRSLAAILKGDAPKDWRQVFLVEHWQELNNAGGRNRANRNRLSAEADCQHSGACFGHCNHMAPCYCCGAESESAVVATYNSDTECDACNKAELSQFSEEEKSELAQESGAQEEDSLPMTEERPIEDARVRPGRQNQNLQPLGGTREFGGRIPQYHALRHPDASFVEYVTGEREYYRLVSDPYEINNLVSTTPTSTIKAESTRAGELSGSHRFFPSFPPPR